MKDNKVDMHINDNTLGFHLRNDGSIETGAIDDWNYNDDLIVENTTSTKKKIPGWISSCNFVCLLNLPDAMREFGPLRNLWEGSYQGEGYLRIAKKHMKTGLRGNWTFNTLKKVLQEKSFFHILKKYRDEDISNENTTEVFSGSFYSYKSRHKAFYDYHNGKPLSVIYFDNNSFGFIFNNGNVFLPIQIDQYIGLINGCHYHYWNFPEENIETDIMFGKNLNYCLLLPRYLITKEERHKEQYTLITNNWTEIQEDGSITLLSFPKI